MWEILKTKDLQSLSWQPTTKIQPFAWEPQTAKTRHPKSRHVLAPQNSKPITSQTTFRETTELPTAGQELHGPDSLTEDLRTARVLLCLVFRV